MQRVSNASFIHRLLTTPVKRALSLLFAIAQMTVVMAPALHARLGSDTKAHFENGGTRMHYTHDETACPACSAPQGDRVQVPPVLAESPRHVVVHGAREIGVVTAAAYSVSRPRAPPVV